MAPQPRLYNSLMSMIYVVEGLTHHQDIGCDASMDISGDWFITAPTATDGHITPLAAADIWWTVASGLFSSDVLTPSWVLYNYQLIGKVPVASGSMSGGPGTHGSAAFLGTVLTFTFRDLANKRVNFAFNEVSWEAPGKSITNATPTQFANLQASIITPGTGTTINDWARGLSDTSIRRQLRWTNTLARRNRKRRSLA